MIKTGDYVILRDGRCGVVCCPGFKDFIHLENGDRINLKSHLTNTYTDDLNHRKDKSLDIILLNGEEVKKTPITEKIERMKLIAKELL